MLNPADRVPVAGRLAHVAVAARGAGHAFVCVSLRGEVSAAYIIVFRLDLLVGYDLFDLWIAWSMGQLVMDRLCSEPSLTYGMGDKAESCCVPYCKYLYIRCLADLIDCYPAPFVMYAGR